MTTTLEHILEDFSSSIKASNQPFVDETIDFVAVEEAYRTASSRYGEARKSGATTLSLKDWLAQESVQDPKSSHLVPARNFSLLKREADQRIKNGSRLQNIILDISDLDRSLHELAESIENTKLIQDIYRNRKQLTKADGGIATEEAAKLKHCFSQGRELFRSGNAGSLVVKPLNYFYAITAYAYGIILLNNPTRYRKDMLPGSHGINYLPDSVRIQFGGDMPRGTFSDLFTSFPQNLIKGQEFELVGSNLHSVVEFYKNRCECSLGTLLSMVPEMGSYYSLSTGRSSRSFQLKIIPSKQVTDPSPTFVIGDGTRTPSGDDISKSFPNMDVDEVRGQYQVRVPFNKITEVRATIYPDIHGDLWYIENPFSPIQLPEICLHFLALSIFANVMRYRPDEWGGLVDNDVSASVSIAARHYFSVLERKFNALILRDASNFFPIAPRTS